MSLNNPTESEIPLGEVRRNFALVCLVLTGAFLVHSMLMVTIPVHAIKLGMSAWQLGVIFSAPSLLPLLLAIPMGGLVTRYGGRILMMIGALLLMLGLLVIVLIDGYVGVLLGRKRSF